MSGFKLLTTIIVILHAQKTSKAEALIYCELFLNKYFDCGCDNFLSAVMLDACLPETASGNVCTIWIWQQETMNHITAVERDQVWFCATHTSVRLKQVKSEQRLKRRQITEVEQDAKYFIWWWCCRANDSFVLSSIHKYADNMPQDIYASRFGPLHWHVTAHCIRISNLKTLSFLFPPLLSFHNPQLLSPLFPKKICANKTFGTSAMINRLIIPINLIPQQHIIFPVSKYI